MMTRSRSIGSVVVVPKVDDAKVILQSQQLKIDQIVCDMFSNKLYEIVTTKMVHSEYVRTWGNSDDIVLQQIHTGLSIMQYVNYKSLSLQQARNGKCIKARAVYDIYHYLMLSWGWVSSHTQFHLVVGSTASRLMHEIDSLYNSCIGSTVAKLIKPNRQRVERVLQFAIDNRNTTPGLTGNLPVKTIVPVNAIRRSSRIANAEAKSMM